jgi:hypothetical protein
MRPNFRGVISPMDARLRALIPMKRSYRLRTSAVLVGLGLGLACSGALRRPPGPPPEYEERPTIPWGLASATGATPGSVGELPLAEPAPVVSAVLSNDAGVQ